MKTRKKKEKNKRSETFGKKGRSLITQDILAVGLNNNVETKKKSKGNIISQ